MPKSAINFDTVRNIGLTLPGVEEHGVRGPGPQGPWKTPGVCPCESLSRTRFTCGSRGFR